MSEGAACPHGLEDGWSSLAGIMWAGPVGFCRCHHGAFGYIDSGSWSEGGSRTITNDPGLCPPCGGKAVETLTGSGEYSFMPGAEDRWYRRTWHTDADGRVHDETVAAPNPLRPDGEPGAGDPRGGEDEEDERDGNDPHNCTDYELCKHCGQCHACCGCY